MPLQIDSLLQERYHIVRSIKSGGMGAVYEARDTKLADSPCAVKEILETARHGRDSEYIQRSFKEEMGNLARLDHPSIPKVRDFLCVNSTIYIVMDLVQGRSLEEEVEEAMRLNGAPPAPEKCVEDIIQLLDTLNYLHSHEPPIVHRDVKPANILRDNRNGLIKLVDFGLARKLDQTSGQTVVGTLGYCPPEQMMGKAERASDIFSVGVTLNHLLTGKAPEMINFEPLRPELPGVRPGLAEIVEKATQLKPADRYATAPEMVAALKGWLDGTKNTVARPWAVAAAPLPAPVRAAPTTRTELAASVVPTRETQIMPAPSRVSSFVAVGAAALGGALVMGLMLGRGTPPQTSPTPMALENHASPSPITSATPTPVAAAPAPPPSKPAQVQTPTSPPPRFVYHAPVQPTAAPPQERHQTVEVPSIDGGPAYPTAPPEANVKHEKPPAVEPVAAVEEPPAGHAANSRAREKALRWAKNHPEFIRKHRPGGHQGSGRRAPYNPNF